MVLHIGKTFMFFRSLKIVLPLYLIQLFFTKWFYHMVKHLKKGFTYR